MGAGKHPKCSSVGTKKNTSLPLLSPPLVLDTCQGAGQVLPPRCLLPLALAGKVVPPHSPPWTFTFGNSPLGRGHGGMVPAQGRRLSQGRPAGMGRSAIWLRHWAAYLFFSKNWESHSPSDLLHMSGKTTPWAHVQINHACCLPVPGAGAGCKVQPAGFSSVPGTPQQPKGKGRTPPGLCQSAKSIPSPLAAGARPSFPGLSTASHLLLRK